MYVTFSSFHLSTMCMWPCYVFCLSAPSGSSIEWWFLSQNIPLVVKCVHACIGFSFMQVCMCELDGLLVWVHCKSLESVKLVYFFSVWTLIVILGWCNATKTFFKAFWYHFLSNSVESVNQPAYVFSACTEAVTWQKTEGRYCSIYIYIYILACSKVYFSCTVDQCCGSNIQQ